MQNHFKEMHLIENFRSNQAIVNVSGRVVNRKSYIVGKKEQTANTPLVAWRKGRKVNTIIPKSSFTGKHSISRLLYNCQKHGAQEKAFRSKIR